MFSLLRSRIAHGYQAIPDIRKAKVNDKHRGFPVVREALLSKGELEKLPDCCQNDAIALSPLRIDLGKCDFCGECERLTKNGAIRFSNFLRTSASSRERLIVASDLTEIDYEARAVTVREEIRRLFGHSFKIRSVSAGGCNACEMELNACTNVNFDMGRFGFDIVASPRHADAIVVTGPITENMAAALMDTYLCTPQPRIVIAMGACAISAGRFALSPAVNRKFFEQVPPDLYIPGCPSHPLTVINGILDFLGKKK